MKLSDVSIYFNESSLDEIIVKVGGTHHTSYEFGSGFAKGDSYLSTVSRLAINGVDLNGKSMQVNVIIKSMPENIHRRKVFRSADFFRNEINFYTKVLPAMEEFQKAQNPSNPFLEFPKAYLSHLDGENDFLVLENLNNSGYVAPPRTDYTSFKQAELTLKTLGRFHALSLAFKAREPNKFQEITQALSEVYYDNKYRTWYVDFLEVAMKVARHAIGECYPNTPIFRITEKYLANNHQLYDDLIKMVSEKPKFAAIGHGDCWTPNFLTKFDGEGKPVALKMIDFQLARYASFALDLSFFVYSCTSKNIRELHYDDLIKSYHASACDLLNQLGCDASVVFPFDEMMEELTKFGRFGCAMGIESIPMSIIEDNEIADLDSITDNNVLTDVWKLSPFTDKAKCQRIADIFDHAISKNYIVVD